MAADVVEGGQFVRLQRIQQVHGSDLIKAEVDSESDTSYMRGDTGTYLAYGNDGNHFNGDINVGENRVVASAIADALYYASDHLPVMLELSYPTTLAVADRPAWPVTYALHQNYPNPFNPGTTIQFDLPVVSDTRITVYDLLGREVVRLVDGRLEPGYHRLVWNGWDTRGRAVPTGMYIVWMMTPEFGKNIKMLLLR